MLSERSSARWILAGLLVLGLVAALINASGVDWENYSPSVKERIDDMAFESDCDGLQREFDTAERNDDAQRARTGDGNADLMGYIDSKLEDAGCYG